MATVVFCEDDPTIQKLIRVALRNTSHEVHVAGDGAEGLRLVERLRPDVVFTDLAMPELDGFELLRRMRAHAELAAIPIVFLTASAQRSEVEAGLAAGVVDYLTKPFAAADLRAKVDEHAPIA